MSGLHALKECETPFDKAAAYFLFAADNQFYFDGNKRTARAMMNGLLLAAGAHAVLVPAQAREEFNETMRTSTRTATQPRSWPFSEVAAPESTRLGTCSSRSTALCEATAEAIPLETGTCTRKDPSASVKQLPQRVRRELTAIEPRHPAARPASQLPVGWVAVASRPGTVNNDEAAS